MKRTLTLVAIATVASFAWDGQRQGFLLGIGAGAASQAYGVDAEVDGQLESQSGGSPLTTSRIGYAWSNTGAIELYNNSFYQQAGMTGYSALNFHWWNNEELAGANSWFGGLGFLAESPGIKRKGMDPMPPSVGFGLNVGYGREIAPHFGIELGLVVGGLADENYYYDTDREKWIEGDETTDITFAAFTISANLLGF